MIKKNSTNINKMNNQSPLEELIRGLSHCLLSWMCYVSLNFPIDLCSQLKIDSGVNRKLTLKHNSKPDWTIRYGFGKKT